MKPLGSGKSVVITARLPAHLHAALKAAVGSRRGAQSQWLRDVLERELAPATPPVNQHTGTHA